MGRMNRNQDQRDDYQNLRIYQYPNNRVYQNRAANLNPHYQNPVDLVRVQERNNGSQENIYERLDNDDEDERNNENNEADGNDREAVVVRNEPNDQNDRDHMYERIDNRPWYRGGGYSNHHHRAPNNFPTSSVFWNAIERNANRYDPREIYLPNNAYLNRLSLSRNCFSTDNVAMAGNSGRNVYHLGHNCMCQFCTRLPFIRYHMCQQCSSSFHDRLRCYDDSGGPSGASGSSRNYIYQISRSCRCAYCRGGDYSYSRFPISAASRLVDALRRDCHQCGRNHAQCNCRSRLLTTAAASNSAIYIGRIDRIGFVNNPLYANPMIYVGRIERSLGNQEAGNEDLPASAAGNSAGAASGTGEASGERNSSQAGPSNQANVNANANASVNVNDNGDVVRQHTCDDSCIRNNANAPGTCQFINRNERSSTECNGGRVSYHWWFVNRWLPPWGSQDRNSDTASANLPAGSSSSSNSNGNSNSNASTSASAPRVEEPRDPPGSDSDEP